MLRILATVVFAFALLMCASPAQAQVVDTLWTTTYWGGSYDSLGNVCETADRGFVMTTMSVLPDRSDFDMVLIKTDSLGEVEWTRYYGSTLNEGGLHVLQTSDGGYLVSAQSKLTGSSGGSGGLWIVRTDAAGDTLWTFPYCPTNRVAYPLHAIQLEDGSFAVTGMINTPSGSMDGFILRLDDDGGFIDYGYYGNSWSQFSRFVAPMSDSGFVIAGYTNGATNGGDWWVVRVNKYLDQLWDSTYVLTSSYDELGDACLVGDGMVMVGRASSVGHARKVDYDGHTVWDRAVVTDGSSYEEHLYTVSATSDGGLIVGGLATVPSYRRDYFLTKLNGAGDSLWTFTVGGGDDDHGRSVIQTYDGNYVLAGKSSSWVNGTCTWLVKIGAPGCCVERVGDVNGDGDDEPSLADAALLVDALFISLNVDDLPCLTEADVNQSGGASPTATDISLADVMVLIDYLFITGPSLGLPDCL